MRKVVEILIRISNHSKKRIIERTEDVNFIAEAKKIAKQAFLSGKTINDYQKYQDFYNYLRAKKSQANNCTIRVYKNNIFIWRGKNKTLVTAYPIPKIYVKMMED